ncbi:MAG TPA: helix-turn-helix domain-containing protein [Solirubrobacteraceae bacterium]|nr:helix-turn-helix domain-containing protein [Solirubrobacteraceae bacterium]
MPPSEPESPPEGFSPRDSTPERQLPDEQAPRRAEESSVGRFTQESPKDTVNGEPLVSVALSRNQVDHVVRAALGEDAVPSVSAVVAGTGFHRTHARQVLSSRYRALQENRRLSRSLLAGLLVLSCFPPEGLDMGIKDISEQLELNTSTVHRYVLTLVAAGLLERDPDTRRYRLLPE